MEKHNEILINGIWFAVGSDFIDRLTALEQFVITVRNLRDLQKEYFKTRNKSTLNTCQQFERKIDKDIKAFLEPKQNTLL